MSAAEILIETGREVMRNWSAHSKALAPIDREMVERPLRTFHSTLKNKAGASVQWVQSPMEGMLKAATQLSHNARTLTNDAMLHFKSADARIEKEIAIHIQKACRSLSAHLDTTCPAVSKVAALELSLRVDVLKEHKGLLSTAIRSALDITPSMIAPYDFVRRAFGLDTNVNALVNAAMVGWVWFFPDVIIVSERPTKIVLDAAGRLHCDDGPALVYADGFSVFAHRNTWVPEDQVLGNASDWKEIEKVKDVDVQEAVVGSKINKWSKATAKTEQAKEERDEAAEAVLLLGGIGGVRDLVESGE